LFSVLLPNGSARAAQDQKRLSANRKPMERIDASGVPDLILLDAITEESVYKTICNRYYKDQIYVCQCFYAFLTVQTYIGDVVISVNPYKDVRNTSVRLS
jgi:myosin heavy subunit